MDKQKLAIYDKLIEKCPGIERKGKTVPHTSANGYMYSLFNKDNEIGIRFGKENQEKYIAQFKTTIYKSHGAIMKGYVLIPESMWDDLDSLSKYVIESHKYVCSLPSK